MSELGTGRGLANTLSEQFYEQNGQGDQLFYGEVYAKCHFVFTPWARAGPRYVEGDLLNSHRDGITVIGQQCNCRRVWRGGIHRLIGERFPRVIDQYLAHSWRLGDMRLFESTIPGFRIAYLAGQDDYGNSQTTGKVYTVLPKLREAMTKLNGALTPEDQLAFPLIGAGLAGGDWRQIAATISESFAGRTVAIYILPGTVVSE